MISKNYVQMSGINPLTAITEHEIMIICSQILIKMKVMNDNYDEPHAIKT